MDAHGNQIKGCDMAPEVVEDAIKTAADAFKNIPANFDMAERERAKLIKQSFDRKYGGTWHCIVGRDFGSYISHESKNFINFYQDEFSILLFKAG